ncbi:MAG: acetate/propionate family kinase [Arenicellales bacterium]
MTRAVLAVNAGSSSIKFALFGFREGGEDLTVAASGQFSGIGDTPQLTITNAGGETLASRKFAADRRHEQLFEDLLEWIESRSADFSLAAAGHRIVHGGDAFSAPVLIDEGILKQLDSLAPLAPLHQPHNVAAVRALSRIAPDLPQVACFDTAFHAAQPTVATLFALPRELTEAGVRRYGFHGLSYEYIASVLPEHAGPAADGRVIVAHLGHGASMCAMRERRSVATTMGMTALDGLPMGRRCGALDPGVLLYLLKEKGMSYESLSDLLYDRSGLLGVSGISDDMRDLLASRTETARQAVELFVYRLCRELGSLSAALGGLDALVFTGGIGEHAAPVREAACRSAAWLGIELDARANAKGQTRISTAGSRVAVLVIPTDEDLMIARHTLSTVIASGRADHESEEL